MIGGGVMRVGDTPRLKCGFWNTCIEHGMRAFFLRVQFSYPVVLAVGTLVIVFPNSDPS